MANGACACAADASAAATDRFVVRASARHGRAGSHPSGKAPADDDDANGSATTMPAIDARHATCRIDGEDDE